MIGANNSGKTNLVDAIRIFYEGDLKFTPGRDWPKFPIDDEESWIEIEYFLTEVEFNNLKDNYKLDRKTLRVRKYLKSPNQERFKTNQSNLFGYEKEGLSNSYFYGARNISEAKLGDIIYIPEVAKVDEYTKLSGPSAFRNLLEFVIKKVIKNSKAFEDLGKAFSNFNDKFKDETSSDGISLKNLVKDINNEIKSWDIRFGVNINPIKPQEIIRNLIIHYLEDKNLVNQQMDVGSFGQGLQRHLIYILIKLSSKYKELPPVKDKKEFSPDFTLILFEEPEAFLHPTQQEILNISLKEISLENNQQVLATTHSTHFISRNIDDITSLVKLSKNGPETVIYQVNDATLQNILSENQEIKDILGEEITKKDIELESIRYYLWLDPDRCCAFFANIVLICEGLSEKALIDYLIKSKRLVFGDNDQIYILNAGGKYDIHKYMNLFYRFGIKHSILYDGDLNKDKNLKINNFIKKNKNNFTLSTFSFSGEFEDFLNIEKVNKNYLKPLNVMWHYRNNKISIGKIKDLINIIKGLVGSKSLTST